MNRIFQVFSLILCLAWFNASAQSANIENGKRIAAQLCVSCHGANGISSIGSQPNLSGQVSGYIYTQLKRFKSGARPNIIMSGFVANLSDQDMLDLDAYYVSLPPYQGTLSPTDVENTQRAEKLYRWGDTNANLPACLACHGSAGAGIPSLFPRIAGQHSEYTLSRLKAYGEDSDHYNAYMTPIASRLSNEQMQELAIYLQGLRP